MEIFLPASAVHLVISINMYDLQMYAIEVLNVRIHVTSELLVVSHCF